MSRSAQFDRRFRRSGMPSSRRQARRDRRVRRQQEVVASAELRDVDGGEEAVQKEEDMVNHVLALLESSAQRVVAYRTASKHSQTRRELLKIAQRIDRVADMVERHHQQLSKERGRI